MACQNTKLDPTWMDNFIYMFDKSQDFIPLALLTFTRYYANVYLKTSTPITLSLSGPILVYEHLINKTD